MAIIQKTRDFFLNVGKVMEKGKPLYTIFGTAIIKNSVDIPQEIKNRTAYDLAIPLLGVNALAANQHVVLDHRSQTSPPFRNLGS